jgi:hypothetical protein
MLTRVVSAVAALARWNHVLIAGNIRIFPGNDEHRAPQVNVVVQL